MLLHKPKYVKSPFSFEMGKGFRFDFNRFPVIKNVGR